MDIKRSGSRPSAKPSPDYFTGAVRQDPLNEAPARVRAVLVTSTPISVARRPSRPSSRSAGR